MDWKLLLRMLETILGGRESAESNHFSAKMPELRQRQLYLNTTAAPIGDHYSPTVHRKTCTNIKNSFHDA